VSISKRTFLKYGVAGLATTLAAPYVRAAGYPEKAIRYIAPFSPGGATDLIARIMADPMGKLLGQPVVVDNRPGAAGLIGTRLGIQSPPDGYTIFAVASSYLTFPSTIQGLDFDLNDSISPITQIVSYPSVFLVKADFPAKTVDEFVKLARQDPGKYPFASSGIGTASHLAGELLKKEAGIDIDHVPYRGGSPANLDLVAGQVAFHFGPIGSAIQYLRDGRMRALAVATKDRMPLFPDVPTMEEAGFPGFFLGEFQGIVGPAGVPADTIAKLNSAAVESLHQAEVRDTLEQQGAIIVANKPNEFAEFIRVEGERWNRIAREAGVKPSE